MHLITGSECVTQSSPLFSLGDAALVQRKLSFPVAEAGLVVAHLDDTVGPDVDSSRHGLLVVVNPFPRERSVILSGAGWSPHALSADAHRTRVSDGAATVPPRSVVVLQR